MKIKCPSIVLMLMLILSIKTFAQESSSVTPKEKNKDASERTRSKETMDYDSRVYNECTSEWVHLTGKITYSIKEMKMLNKYFISYQINLSQVTGVGEKSGTIYKGGGVIKDQVNAVNKNGHTVGNDLYKVVYRAPNSTLTYNQKAHYVFANGDVKVSFNDVADSCQ
jgi:hypothetical protein